MRSTRRTLTGAATALAALAATAGGQGYVYPARGQSPQQQQKDQGECSGWAMQQTGVNPAAMPPPGPQGRSCAAAREGRRSARWAARSVATRARARRIGAATGALLGGMRRADQRRAADQAQAQASAAYGRAYAACLEGRGYTVK